MTEYNRFVGLQEVSKEEDSDKKQYFQYKIKGDGFYPMGSTVTTIPAGFYKPAYDSYSGEHYLMKKNVITPKLYELPNESHDLILNNIKKFWESEEKYRKFKVVYKRNILLYSVPGNGKTCLINLLCRELIEKHNGVIICIDTQRELEYYSKMMGKFREIEPNRKVITIIEDFERLAKDDFFSALLLQILDGNEQLDSVVTIATTNYPEKLEKRFTCRPSRFNLVVEVQKPTRDVREFYITNKLKDGEIEINKKDLKRLLDKTEGFTFDFVKEVVQGIFIDDIPENIVFERVNKSIQSGGMYKVSEEDKKIGFSNSLDEFGMDLPVPEEDESDYAYAPNMPRQIISPLSEL